MKVLPTIVLSFVAIISGLICALSTICAFSFSDSTFFIFAVIALGALIGSVRLLRRISKTE